MSHCGSDVFTLAIWVSRSYISELCDFSQIRSPVTPLVYLLQNHPGRQSGNVPSPLSSSQPLLLFQLILSVKPFLKVLGFKPMTQIPRFEREETTFCLT